MIRWWTRWRARWQWPSQPCADCGVELIPDTPLDIRDWQTYMVHDRVWAAAGMAPLGGWLCIGWLEGRLGRPLTGADFPLPLNDLDADKDIDWLAELKRAAAEHNRRST
ncbi:MAG: hypothetical protein ACRD0P_24485 [Stackebrandtia sp.]